MDDTSSLTRRRALGLALGAGAAAALAGSGTVVGGSPAGGEAGRASGLLAVPARVTASSAGTVGAEALDPADEPTEPWTAVPVTGFPWGLAPRSGDHVTVTDSVVDMALAAVPLCSWVTGVATVVQGAYQIAGRRTVPTGEVAGPPGTALANAASAGRTVEVALLDTDLTGSLVLQVRVLPAPAGGSGA